MIWQTRIFNANYTHKASLCFLGHKHNRTKTDEVVSSFGHTYARKISRRRAWRCAQWLRAPAAPLPDPVLIASTHIEAHRQLSANESDASSGLLGCQVHNQHRHVCRQNTRMYNITFKKINMSLINAIVMTIVGWWTQKCTWS